MAEGMTIEELHTEVDTYTCVWAGRALLHALIDLGIVTELVCMIPKCRYPGQPFKKNARRGDPLIMSFDHIVQRQFGGHDRPSNLRIGHLGCNAAQGRWGPPWNLGISPSPETRAKLSEASRVWRARGGTSPGRTGIPASAETRALQSAGVKAARERMGPDARRAAALKAWETRRAREIARLQQDGGAA